MTEVSALKIRLKFKKHGTIRYIGHLDMMRYFQKAIRRAGIDIKYSEGFSPHQIMSFAFPLGVGMESDAEYVDITVNDTKSTKESIAALNAVMAEGVEITGYVQLPDNTKPAMSQVAAARYTAALKEGYTLPVSEEELKQKFDAFLSQPSIVITKKTKKGEKQMDLKPLIFEADLDGTTFSFFVSSGSNDNLNPNFILDTFFEQAQIAVRPYAFLYTRQEVYALDPAKDEPCYMSLLDFGTQIV
jgi:radical SAM-linked protein